MIKTFFSFLVASSFRIFVSFRFALIGIGESRISNYAVAKRGRRNGNLEALIKIQDELTVKGRGERFLISRAVIRQ